MEQQPLYLVPCDFTSVSESALRIGLDLSHANNGRVVLLHVAKSATEKREAQFKFKDLMEAQSADERDLITAKVIIGDLFEDMSKAADLLDSTLIVMGTHGAKGMQKIFGSNAVKMIGNSSVPFLITQGKKSFDKIKTIVMPFSYDKKSIQVATFAGKMAKKFNATIHLVAYVDKDELHSNHTKTNQIVIHNYLKDNNVSFEFTSIERVAGYEKSLMEYASKVDADLIAAGYYKDGVFTNPNSFIQSMIENELHIPVLTVNAEDLTNPYSGSVGTGY